jgi:hypothetical protein
LSALAPNSFGSGGFGSIVEVTKAAEGSNAVFDMAGSYGVSKFAAKFSFRSFQAVATMPLEQVTKTNQGIASGSCKIPGYYIINYLRYTQALG